MGKGKTRSNFGSKIRVDLLHKVDRNWTQSGQKLKNVTETHTNDKPLSSTKLDKKVDRKCNKNEFMDKTVQKM